MSVVALEGRRRGRRPPPSAPALPDPDEALKAAVDAALALYDEAIDAGECLGDRLATIDRRLPHPTLPGTSCRLLSADTLRALAEGRVRSLAGDLDRTLYASEARRMEEWEGARAALAREFRIPELEAECADAEDRLDRALAALARMPAATPSGAVAKAALLTDARAGAVEAVSVNLCGALAFSLAADVVRLGGSAP